MPLQLGIGIQLHHKFESRFLIGSLHKHVFCTPYKKDLKYEICTAVHQGIKISGLSESNLTKPTHLIHHVADIADRNPKTLDGRNTFHSMSIIYSVTLAASSSFAIPRLEDVSTKDLIRLTETEQEILPPSRRTLRLKFFRS